VNVTNVEEKKLQERYHRAGNAGPENISRERESVAKRIKRPTPRCPRRGQTSSKKKKLKRKKKGRGEPVFLRRPLQFLGLGREERS